MAYPRRIFFINKRFQTKFILNFVLIVLGWAVATVGIYMYLVSRKLDDIRYSSHVDVNTTGELLLPITIGTNLASLLVFAAILAFTMRSVWNKLSPPLYSIKKDMARIAEGNLTGEVTLCKGEEFQELAYELEKMRQGLNYNLTQIKEHQQALKTATDDLEQALATGTPSAAQAAAVQAAAANIRGAIQRFQI